MKHKFLVYCKNDPSKTFFLQGVEGMVFDDSDNIQIFESGKGRVFNKPQGVSSLAISAAMIKAE